MRARLVLGWLVGAVLVAGCDTNQPIRQEQQSITLQFRATSAEVQEMWTYAVYEDSNGDGLPDDTTGDGVEDEYLWCNPQANYVGSEMPWSFSVQVDLIRAGTTQPVTIARETDANQSFARYATGQGGSDAPPIISEILVTTRTGYCGQNQGILCNPDNFPSGSTPATICALEAAGSCVASGSCSGDSSVTCLPDAPTDSCQNQGLGTCDDNFVARRFVFTPISKGISGASEATMSAPVNILYAISPSQALLRGPTGGLCPGRSLGPANVGGNPTPWTFTIDQGDTVSVKARRFDLLPPGFAVTSGPPPIDPTIVYINGEAGVADPISATILVDGSPVGVTGTTTTTPGDPESYIDFFFTSN